MEKMKMQTTDVVDENIRRIGELFPYCLTERLNTNGESEVAIDFDKLKQELSRSIVEGAEERYLFTWPDKRNAIRLANAPTTDTLRPCRDDSVDFDNTKNLYIEGDNLVILKLLRENYLGKVKMIYIDPPYNTGCDFIYNDNFSQDLTHYIHNSGQVDNDGNQLVANFETNGRFHTDWLNMIYPRLKVARDLLTEDGVIFISIDDNELNNIRKMCDEIFNEKNFINLISVSTKNTAGASGGGEDKRLKKNIEYILMYAKSYSKFPGFKKVYVYTELSELIEQYKEEGSSWKYTSVLLDSGQKEYICSTIDGEGNEIKIYRRLYPVIKSVNQLSQEEKIQEKEIYKKYGTLIFQTTNAQSSIRDRIIDARKENDIQDDILSIEYVPRSGKNKGKVYEQFYKGDKCRLFVWLRDTSEIIDGTLYKKDSIGTLWDVVGETKNLTKEGGVAFPNGKKPVYLLSKLCQMQTTDADIIMDFFSGSSTTAHAVMQTNKEDCGQRKFIMVQIPEDVDKDSLEANDGQFKNICEIGKERIRRAGKKIIEEQQNKQPDLFCSETKTLDVGFRVLKLDSSNMHDVYYTPAEFSEKTLFDTNIKPDRTDEDLLFQVMIELGIELSAKIEKTVVADKNVWKVADGELIACFAEDVNEEVITTIAKQKPRYFVMRDASLSSDQVADNFEQIFEHYSKDTIRRII